jgi:putative ABC transport system substrate-binding protein
LVIGDHGQQRQSARDGGDAGGSGNGARTWSRSHHIRNPAPEDIAPAFEALKGRAEGLYICNDPLVTTNRTRLAALPLGVRLPTMRNVREFVAAEGLMFYGPNFLTLYRRAGDFVDKILRGAKPADTPVEQPTRFDLIFNLRTAKALGLTVPPALLGLADEVIE